MSMADLTTLDSSCPIMEKIRERYPVDGTISANAGWVLKSFSRASVTCVTWQIK